MKTIIPFIAVFFAWCLNSSALTKNNLPPFIKDKLIEISGLKHSDKPSKQEALKVDTLIVDGKVVLCLKTSSGLIYFFEGQLYKFYAKESTRFEEGVFVLSTDKLYIEDGKLKYKSSEFEIRPIPKSDIMKDENDKFRSHQADPYPLFVK